MEPTAEEHRRFFQEIDFVLGAARQRLAKNPNDTAALYAQGVAFGFRANYNFLVRKAYLDSLRDATNGRKALDRVAALDPSNVDARLGQGAHEYVIGSLSLAFRIVGFLAGFHGDRENGIRIIRMVAQKGRLNRLDAELMLAAIYRRERRPKDAIPLLNDMIRRFPRNYLLRFELSQMYADSIDKDSALRVLDEIEKLKRSAAPGYQKLPIERVYFSRGVVQFWYRDFNDAVENLKRVTASAPELDLNTATTAWLRLGQTYDLLGQRPLAEQAYRSGIALAPQSEQARECRGYLSSPYKRKI
jgi:tetratricopeptide (TPR) repeat protein